MCMHLQTIYIVKHLVLGESLFYSFTGYILYTRIQTAAYAVISIIRMKQNSCGNAFVNYSENKPLANGKKFTVIKYMLNVTSW